MEISAVVFLCFVSKIMHSIIEDNSDLNTGPGSQAQSDTACRKKHCLPRWGWLLSNGLFIWKGPQKNDWDGLKTFK